MNRGTVVKGIVILAVIVVIIIGGSMLFGKKQVQPASAPV